MKTLSNHAHILKEYYVVDQYGERDEEVKNRVRIQEFACWIIGSGWNFLGPYAPEAEWNIIRTKSDLKEMPPGPMSFLKELFPKSWRCPAMKRSGNLKLTKEQKTCRFVILT